MTELSQNWKEIFNEISTADTHITGKVNYYNLTSHLEDLYLQIAELRNKVEELEKDKQPWAHPQSGVASTILGDK